MHLARKVRIQMKLAVAVLFAATALPALCQVVPAAQEGGLPLVVGAGIAVYDTEIDASYWKGHGLG